MKFKATTKIRFNFYVSLFLCGFRDSYFEFIIMPYFSVNAALKFMRLKYKSNFKVLIEYEVFYHVCMAKGNNSLIMEKGSLQP